MGIGLGISQAINITSLTHLVPVCTVLSGISIYTTYKSACVLDEIHLNNQRANLFFNQFIADGTIMST